MIGSHAREIPCDGAYFVVVTYRRGSMSSVGVFPVDP